MLKERGNVVLTLRCQVVLFKYQLFTILPKISECKMVRLFWRDQKQNFQHSRNHWLLVQNFCQKIVWKMIEQFAFIGSSPSFKPYMQGSTLPSFGCFEKVLASKWYTLEFIQNFPSANHILALWSWPVFPWKW